MGIDLGQDIADISIPISIVFIPILQWKKYWNDTYIYLISGSFRYGYCTYCTVDIKVHRISNYTDIADSDKYIAILKRRQLYVHTFNSKYHIRCCSSVSRKKKNLFPKSISE